MPRQDNMECVNSVVTVALTLMLAVGQVDSRKIWKPNTNYKNGANWNAGRPPCYKDNIKIPEESNTVFIQTNATISTLTLPTNGEVVFGDNMVLSFGSQEAFPAENKQSCTSGQSIEYIRTKPASWFDVDNWCSSGGTKCDSQAEYIDTLDTEKVPCMEEETVLPEASTFWVDLHSDLNIFVGKILYDGKEYTSTSQFKSFLDSKSGQKQFVTTSSGERSKVNIRDGVCSDKTGCICGNSQGEIQKKICSFKNCPSVNCSNAFKPIGGCCFMCGALLDMDYGAGFDMSRLKAVINDLYLKGQTGIKAFVSKLPSSVIQAVFSDKTDGSDALGVATDFFNQVNQDIKGDNKYKFGITSVTIQTSGQSGGIHPTGSPSKQRGKSTEISSGGIAGVAIACVVGVILVLVCVGVFVWRKRTPTSKMFKIFSRKETNGDLECTIDASVKYDEPPAFDLSEANGVYIIDADRRRGFDNPLYQSSPNGKDMGMANFQLSLSSKEEQPVVGHFINPLYSEEGIEEDSQI